MPEDLTKVSVAEKQEERDLSSRLSIFSSQYSDYQNAQDEDRERLEQAKALAKVHQGQFSDTANFDIKRLERTAYDMLSAGYDSKYIGEQFARGTFSELQNMGVEVDPLMTLPQLRELIYLQYLKARAKKSMRQWPY